MNKLALAGSVLALLACEGRAPACSFGGDVVYEIDPQEQAVDVTPPGAVSVVELVIIRGEMGGCEDGGSCNDIGRIRLTLAASDNRTRPRTSATSYGSRPESVHAPTCCSPKNRFVGT